VSWSSTEWTSSCRNVACSHHDIYSWKIAHLELNNNYLLARQLPKIIINMTAGQIYLILDSTFRFIGQVHICILGSWEPHVLFKYFFNWCW